MTKMGDLSRCDGAKALGAHRQDKDAKVYILQKLWILAINNHGGFGR